MSLTRVEGNMLMMKRAVDEAELMETAQVMTMNC